jgi:hypothetical protein
LNPPLRLVVTRAKPSRVGAVDVLECGHEVIYDGTKRLRARCAPCLGQRMPSGELPATQMPLL